MNTIPLKEIKQVTIIPSIILVICWSIYALNYSLNLNLFELGISPRKASGLIGILIAPLLHVDLNHILSNSLPLFILSAMLFYFYKPIAFPVFFWIYFISGLWLWVGGRNSDAAPFYHFGASILIYGFSTFLFFSGVFRKHKQLMVVSAIVVFLYGSITWGIFPLDETVSWEGHLFGALSGILVAYFYKKDGPQTEEYSWPDDDDEINIDYMQTEEHLNEELPLSNQSTTNSNTNENITIVYHITKKD